MLSLKAISSLKVLLSLKFKLSLKVATGIQISLSGKAILSRKIRSSSGCGPVSIRRLWRLTTTLARAAIAITIPDEFLLRNCMVERGAEYSTGTVLYIGF